MLHMNVFIKDLFFNEVVDNFHVLCTGVKKGLKAKEMAPMSSDHSVEVYGKKTPSSLWSILIQ